MFESKRSPQNRGGSKINCWR